MLNLLEKLFDGITGADRSNRVAPEKRRSKHLGNTKRPMPVVRGERRRANRVAKASRKANRR